MTVSGKKSIMLIHWHSFKASFSVLTSTLPTIPCKLFDSSLKRTILQNDCSHSTAKQKGGCRTWQVEFVRDKGAKDRARVLKFFCYSFVPVLENRKNHRKSSDEATERQRYLKNVTMQAQRFNDQKGCESWKTKPIWRL